MDDFLSRAYELKEEVIQLRRRIHRFGGVGFELDDTVNLVLNTLRGYGLSPKVISRSGVVCNLGNPGQKAILLRADMDALPMDEESGLPYAASNGTAHTCGHDAHTAMLLLAAKLLKEREESLAGTVKLMFQPAEETMCGAKEMIEAGVLENPSVDAAMMIHIATGGEDCNTGTVRVSPGIFMSASDQIKIVIHGTGAHGASAFQGVDPISVACRLVTALHSVVAMELPSMDAVSLTFGRISGGSAANIIPEAVVLEGTLRTQSPQNRSFVKERIQAIAHHTAAAARASAEVSFLSGVPPFLNSEGLAQKVQRHCRNLLGPDRVLPGRPSPASEDFSLVAERVPTVGLWLGAGSPAEGYPFAIHHPGMCINEDVLPIGAAIHASFAANWLAGIAK